MMFPVSDERDFRRPEERAAPRITPLKAFALVLCAILGSTGGFMGAKLYFEAVAQERAEHDAALRRDIIREMRTAPTHASGPAPRDRTR